MSEKRELLERLFKGEISIDQFKKGLKVPDIIWLDPDFEGRPDEVIHEEIDKETGEVVYQLTWGELLEIDPDTENRPVIDWRTD